MLNDKSLICQNYEVTRRVGDLVRVRAEFVLNIDPHKNEEIIEAMTRINQLLAGRVVLVQGQDKLRCTYCGTLQKDDEVICGQCGGKL